MTHIVVRRGKIQVHEGEIMDLEEEGRTCYRVSNDPVAILPSFEELLKFLERREVNTLEALRNLASEMSNSEAAREALGIKE